MVSEKDRTVDVIQTVVALVGITFGVVPLIRWFVVGEHGSLFERVFGDPSGAMGYGMPLIVIVALVAIIAALEVVKKRG